MIVTEEWILTQLKKCERVSEKAFVTVAAGSLGQLLPVANCATASIHQGGDWVGMTNSLVCFLARI